MSDAINIKDIIFHRTNEAIKDFAITKSITRVEQLPGADGGFRMTMSPYNDGNNRDAWPDFIPPTGGPGGGPWEGPMRWTFCLAAKLKGQWHGAAFHQMWSDRLRTGANPLTEWSDGWADPRGMFGRDLTDWRPQVGEQVALWAVAGNHRLMSDHFTLRERSNIVLVNLQLNATQDYTAEPTTPTPPVPPTTPTLPTPTNPVVEGSVNGFDFAAAFGDLKVHMDFIEQRLAEHISMDSDASSHMTVNEVDQRIAAAVNTIVETIKHQGFEGVLGGLRYVGQGRIDLSPKQK